MFFCYANWQLFANANHLQREKPIVVNHKTLSFLKDSVLPQMKNIGQLKLQSSALQNKLLIPKLLL